MEDFSYINGQGTPLRKAQEAMVDILVEFDRVCRKNSLTYWIDYGTLLGAVRHGGFIPWDDDIDVSMPSADFARFKTVANELKEGFFFQDKTTDPEHNEGMGIFKIRKDNTLFINDFEVFNTAYHRGIAIDVFEVVDHPDVSEKTWHFFRKRIFKSYGFFHYNRGLSLHNIACYFLFPIYYVIMKALWKVVCLFHRDKPRTLSRLERTPYGYPTLKSEIFPLQELSFEGHMFPAPKNPDSRLRDNFGPDYMSIPPREKRRIHAKFISTDLGSSYVNL